MAYIIKDGGVAVEGDLLCVRCSNCEGIVRGKYVYCPWCGERFEQLSDDEYTKRETERKEKEEAEKIQKRKEQLWKDFMNEPINK